MTSKEIKGQAAANRRPANKNAQHFNAQYFAADRAREALYAAKIAAMFEPGAL